MRAVGVHRDVIVLESNARDCLTAIPAQGRPEAG
jgi:hypothetical protein